MGHGLKHKAGSKTRCKRKVRLNGGHKVFGKNPKKSYAR